MAAAPPACQSPTEGSSQTSKRNNRNVTETVTKNTMKGARNETETTVGASANQYETGTGFKTSMEKTRINTETGINYTENPTNQDGSMTGTKQIGEDRGMTEKGLIMPSSDQCGLDNDGTVWFAHQAAKRIRATRVTPDEAANYQAIIDACLHTDTVYGKRVNFDPNLIMAVMIEVQPYLASEPVLIEDVPFGINIVGDLHGQLYDLDRVFKMLTKDGKPGYLDAKFLFLGNYVDRGMQSLEVLMLLFSLKILYPDNFILLRGNHEFSDINFDHGLALECDERYCEETAARVFAQVNETLCYLSLAAIVGDIYLCVHGGISTRQFTREELRGLTKPIVSSIDDFLVQDMMWADPAFGLRGTVFNYDRGHSVYFGLDALVAALHGIGCKALFRGHSQMNKGFDNQWDCCYTVYTATGVKNDGSIAVLDGQGKTQFAVIRKDPIRQQLNEELYGEGGARCVDYGTGTGETSVYLRSEEE